MPRGIQRSRVDANHAEIVEALRAAGMSVVSLAAVGNGCPDIAVGYRGHSFLFEIKDPMQPPSKRKLTPDEVKFSEGWRGHYAVIETFEEAMAEII